MVSIHHIALGASDVRLVAQFYRDHFGLEEVEQHLHPDGSVRSIWLAAGETVLMIEYIETPPQDVPLMRQGPFLLAFQISEDQREQTRSDFAARGTLMESESPWTMYFRDPEGNRVAVTHYPHRSPMGDAK